MSHAAPSYWPPPKHPGAQTALVLGIVSVAGLVFVLPLFLSPIAWYCGAKVKREIAASPGQWNSDSAGTVGMILGIIGTVALILLVGLLTVSTALVGYLAHAHMYY